MEGINYQTDSINESREELDNNEDEEIDIYTSYASYMSSSDPGSDNLLVTFDYGFQDSLEADHSLNSPQLEMLENDEDDDDFNKNLFKIPEESSEDLLKIKYAELYSKSPNLFKVHQVQHLLSNNNTRASSCISLAKSLVEYNIDTSGDYGSWAQSESEQDGNDDDNKAPTYRYEDLIKNEVLIYDDDDHDNDLINDSENENDNGKEVLINFKFDEDLPPPRWFCNNNQNNFNNNNEQMYYKSVDYLN